jgi:hypothetical protein
VRDNYDAAERHHADEHHHSLREKEHGVSESYRALFAVGKCLKTKNIAFYHIFNLIKARKMLRFREMCVNLHQISKNLQKDEISQGKTLDIHERGGMHVVPQR